MNEVTIRYQYDNHLGSACLELDESADIISYEEYHPFGTTSYRAGRSLTETSLKRYKYVGKERDEETGLYYYGARYYAAWLCRFVSVDALQHKYPHYTPYQYAGNKPISYIDLDGLEPASSQNGGNVWQKSIKEYQQTIKENAPLPNSTNSGNSTNSLRIPSLPLHQTSNGSADFGTISKSIDNTLALASNFFTGNWNSIVVDFPAMASYNLGYISEHGKLNWELKVGSELIKSFQVLGNNSANYLKKPADEQWSGLTNYASSPQGLQFGFNIGATVLFPSLFKEPAPLPELNFSKPSLSGNFATKTGVNALKFGGDEAVIHFGKHADQIMKVTGKSAYNLKNYVDDANWIIQNGTYSSKLNGYYSFMANGSKGQSLFGFVGMKNGGSSISTFHIKSAAQLGLK